jgi:hypothetical protein
MALLGCVGPPDHADGLLENVPAVVIETDYFSLSVLGDKYTEDNEWELTLDATTSDQILTTLVVKDLVINSSDSTYLYLLDDQGDTILNAGIFSDIIFTSQDSISVIGIPKKAMLNADNFSGRLEYQIIKTPL